MFGGKFSATRKICGHKDLVGNQERDLHVFQIMVYFLFFLACDNSVHHSDIVWSNDLSVYFSFASFRSLIGNFFLAFLQSLIGHFLFFFCFFKHIHNLTVNETSCLGDPSVLSSKGKGKNSYLGSRFMAKGLRFWLKRLAEGKTWRMLGDLLGKWFRDKGMPLCGHSSI